MGKILSLVALLAIIVVGFYLWSHQAKNALEQGADSAVEQARVAKEAIEEKQVITSLREAMGLGAKTTCTFSSEHQGQRFNSTVIVEGQRFQATTVAPDMTIYAINDGNHLFTWTTKDKQGFKVDNVCLEEVKGSVADMPGMNGLQDIEASFEAAGDLNCQPGGNMELAVPEDVTFTDQCALLKQSTEMMQKMQPSSGQTAPQQTAPQPAPSY